MNKQLFLKLLKDPQNILPSDLKGLEEVAASFPYCQAAHILISKGSHEAGSMLAAQKLKKAALFTSDRANLKKIILLKQELSSPAPTLTEVIQEDVAEPESIITEIAEAKAEQQPLIQPLPFEAGNSLPEVITPVEKSIASFQEEPFREDLFKEIEQNLKKLEELRRRHEETISKPVIHIETGAAPELKKEAKEEEKLSVLEIPAEIAPVEKNTVSPASEEEPISEHKHFISSSRLFEELTPEEDGFTKEAEILSAYMDYVRNARTKYKKDKKAELDIIDKFIREDPMISQLSAGKIKVDAPQEDLADKRIKNKLPVSENFAKLMVKQGKIDKAIDIYQQLILKYPEKKAYFATQIENIKNQ